MAETGASRQRSQDQQRQGEALQQGSRQGGMQTRGSVPSLLSLSSRDFFSMSPFALMRRFTEEMDRAFSVGTGTQGRTGPEQSITWIPTVEVRQSGDNLVVSADLPGMSENDVKIEVTEDGLIIEGERQEEQQRDERGFRQTERTYGRFWRLIALPENAQVEQAKANFKNGVLEVTIPVPQTQQKRRSIPISASGEQGQQRQQGAQSQSGEESGRQSRSASQSGS